MTCRQAIERASDFMDGEMPIADRAEVRAHVTRCSECRMYLRQMLMIRSLSGALGREGPTEPVRFALLAMYRSFLLALISKPKTIPSAIARAERRLGQVLEAARVAAPVLTTLLASIAMLVLVHPTPGKFIGLGDGLGCLEMEILGGGLPLLGLFGFVWIRRRPIPVGALAFGGGVGALVCQASLHFTCFRGGMYLHLGLFHFGGVVAMILLGGLAGLAQPASTPLPT